MLYSLFLWFVESKYISGNSSKANNELKTTINMCYNSGVKSVLICTSPILISWVSLYLFLFLRVLLV